jgi:UDP-glucose 4-epimerase
MKILVTGGAGYIGSVVVEQLVEMGEQVVVFDNLSQGHRQAVHPKAELVEGDLSNPLTLNLLFEEYRPEAVMHFASKILVGESMEEPFLYLGDNVVNGLNLFKAMVKYGCRKIILSSTANLFDDPLRASIFKAIDEEERIVSGSPYGESKFILERILHWMDRIYGIRSARLRYFNAAGATVERGEDHRPELHIIPLTLKVALGQRESIFVFGGDWPTPDGSPVRDFVHVSDLARAHILALDRLEKGSVFYNLGNGAGHSILDVVDTARKVTGVKIQAKIVDRRPGDPAVLVAASDKIRRELGWKPKYPGLDEIIGSAWAWHSAHPYGYTTSISNPSTE